MIDDHEQELMTAEIAELRARMEALGLPAPGPDWDISPWVAAAQALVDVTAALQRGVRF